MRLGLQSTLAALLCTSLCACASTDPQTVIRDAMKSSERTTTASARDQYRHPAETLAFFGFEPSMTVVEIWPGGGWYSDILAPALKSGEGTFYAAHFPADSKAKYYLNSLSAYTDKVNNDSRYSATKITEFYPGTHHAIAPEGSADMVLTFRNLHNWYMQGDEEGVVNAFKAFYAALKPGGVLGVVDHRLPETMDGSKAKRSGYVKESWVIGLAQKAGFELVAKSEINANPLDTADHPEGVWTLPPRLALGERDKAKYLAIGESDRMTLKFKKPE